MALIGTGFLIAFIQSESFAHAFDNFLASVVLWISAWGGVALVEFYALRGGRVNVEGLYEPPERSPYGDINWLALGALALGLIAGWAWEYGLVSFMQGPIAIRFGNSDFSWLTAFIVSGTVFYIGSRSSRRPAIGEARAGT